MTATRAGPPLSNGLQPLSCLRCAHRKVRCDRVAPCSNCTKYNVFCEFPQPKTEKRQRRKVVRSPPPTPRSNPRARLNRYKEVLNGLGVDVNSIPDLLRESVVEPLISGDVSPPERVDAATAVGGRLAAAGKQCLYLEDNLWTRIGKNLNVGGVLPECPSQDDEEIPPGTRMGYQASGFTLGLSPDAPLMEELYPTQHHFRELWQLYLSNIHPVTMILHAPSASKVLVEAVKCQGRASNDARTLLFATMACALISITDIECAKLLGQNRATLFSRYRRSCEAALTNANFLMSSKLSVLQAYTIYLVAISSHIDPYELWNLTGIAKRNAQRLGLDQETQPVGVTSFEIEIRRRLWSHIAMYDAMSAQSAGLARSDLSGENVAPSNINDVDLSPNMIDPPKERVGATDMIFCNLRHKVMKFLDTVNSGKRPWALSMEEQRSFTVRKIYQEEREKAVAQMEEELELELLRYCDMLNPVHFLTVIVARLTLCKLRYTMLQPYQYGNRLHDCPEKDKELMFLTALKVLEYENNANIQPFIRGFLWHIHQHFQWSCMRHILEDLKTRPCGEEVDRAWEQIRIFYKLRPIISQSQGHELSPCSGINKAAIEAWQARETWASERGESLAFPSYLASLREQESTFKSKSQALRLQPSFVVGASQPLRGRETSEGLLPVNNNLGGGSTCWPNWASVNLVASNLAGGNINFLDPTLDQEISMSLQGDNNSCFPAPDALPSLDQYVQVGGEW